MDIIGHIVLWTSEIESIEYRRVTTRSCYEHKSYIGTRCVVRLKKAIDKAVDRIYDVVVISKVDVMKFRGYLSEDRRTICEVDDD